MTWNVYNSSGALRTQESSSFGAIVSSLPVSPTDGQIVLYQNAAMATDGVVWTLRYRANSASAYKWEKIGGPPMYATGTGGNIATSAGVYTDIPNNASLTTPLAGDYLISFGASCQNNSSGNASGGSLVLNIAGVDTTGTALSVFNDYIQFQGNTPWRERRINAIAASSVIKMRGETQNGGINILVYHPTIVLDPIRVG